MIFKEIELRAPEPEDIALLYRWENDPAVWQISNTLSPFSQFTLKKYIENSHKSIYEMGQLRLMVEITDIGKTIGSIDLFDFDPFHQRAGIGILIADSKERQKGYASMALEGMIDYSFNRLKLHQLYCNICSDNLPSIKLFSKLGFKESGLKKDWIRAGESYKDEILMQLLIT